MRGIDGDGVVGRGRFLEFRWSRSSRGKNFSPSVSFVNSKLIRVQGRPIRALPLNLSDE